MTTFNSPISIGRKGLFAISSTLFSSVLLLSMGANRAEAAIFTAEFAGTIDAATSDFNSPTQVGDRITGTYTFDDVGDRFISARYNVLLSNEQYGSTLYRDGFEIRAVSDSPADAARRESLESGLLQITASANKNGASFVSRDTTPPVSSYRNFSVTPQTFSESFGAGLAGSVANASFGGQIDQFQILNAATPSQPTDIPEPAVTSGLTVIAGLALRKKLTRS